MKKITNTPLLLAFIIIGIIFLLFCGGAIAMTLTNNSVNQNGLMNNISWMWIPTTVALLLTVLLGWAIFWKKE